MWNLWSRSGVWSGRQYKDSRIGTEALSARIVCSRRSDVNYFIENFKELLYEKTI